jgi:hypothetical protein
MAELKDTRRERFAQLLSLGMDALKAHGQAGYRADKSNASKLARRPDVAARVEELVAAEEQRLAQARGDGASETGEQLLRLAAQKAIATGNLVALVQAGKQIGESDGSLDALSNDREQSVEEILASIDRHGDPLTSLAVRMIAPLTSFERPVRTAEDLELIVRGLDHYLGGQLPELAARLAKTAARMS